MERGENRVGNNHQSYASRPLSKFQRKVRAGVPKDGLLNHVTIHYIPETVERVCSIPMVPGADHRDMPKKLRITVLPMQQQSVTVSIPEDLVVSIIRASSKRA